MKQQHAWYVPMPADVMVSADAALTTYRRAAEHSSRDCSAPLLLTHAHSSLSDEQCTRSAVALFTSASRPALAVIVPMMCRRSSLVDASCCQRSRRCAACAASALDGEACLRNDTRAVRSTLSMHAICGRGMMLLAAGAEWTAR